MRCRSFVLTLGVLYALWVAGVLGLAFYQIVRATKLEPQPGEAFSSRSEESEREYREFLKSAEPPSKKLAEDASAVEARPAGVQEAVAPK
jgi:hypothetical protein